MPLFVTVTPGTTVTSSTTLDAATLNLLGTPSIDVTGSVDGGSLTLSPGSVTNASMATMAATTIKANATGGVNSPTDVPIDSATMTLSGSSLGVKTNGVSYAKIQQVTASRLLGNPTASTANVSEISVGTGLALSVGGVLSSSVASNMKIVGYVALPTAQTITSGAAYTDITSLSITTPTPQSSSSKFLLFAVVSGSTSALGCSGAFQFLRGPTPIGLGTGGSGVAATSSGIALASSATTVSNSATLLFVDEPASAVALTYKVQGKPVGSGNLLINRDYNSSAVYTQSYFVVVELIA